MVVVVRQPQTHLSASLSYFEDHDTREMVVVIRQPPNMITETHHTVTSSRYSSSANTTNISRTRNTIRVPRSIQRLNSGFTFCQGSRTFRSHRFNRLGVSTLLDMQYALLYLRPYLSSCIRTCLLPDIFTAQLISSDSTSSCPGICLRRVIYLSKYD